MFCSRKHLTLLELGYDSVKFSSRHLTQDKY